MQIIDILSKVKKEKRHLLLYQEAKEILNSWGIPTAPSRIVSEREQVVQTARSIGVPIVMKILSPDIVHKSDAGGVITDLRAEDEVIQAFDRMIDHFKGINPPVRIEGVVIEKMVSGVEVIVGTTKDSQFGQVIMFGMGGIWTELLKDTSFRLIPIEPIDAEEMIEDLKSYPLLQGYRGQAANVESLKKLLLSVSDLILHYPEITSIDLNPVFTSPEGSMVTDVRMRIGG